MTTQEIFAKRQILTLEVAKSLIGKKIATTSNEYYMNKPRVNIFAVAEIVDEWEEAARRQYPNNDFENFQQYWASFMKPEQIDERKTTLLLMDEKGQWWHKAHTKYDNWFSEPVFTGSDADREVYYVEVPEQKCIITHPTKGALGSDGNWIYRPGNQIKYAKVFNSVEEAVEVARTLRSSTGELLKTLQIAWLTRSGDFVMPTIYAKVNNETGEIVRYGKN